MSTSENNFKLETIVGLFLVAGIICFAYLAIKLGKIDIFHQNSYEVHALFSSVSGLKEGATVEMAGVKIGSVKKITLDTKKYEADVYLTLSNDVKISSDAIASVKTAGIIGDKYINISQGGSSTYLKDGQVITETESALDLEGLISKYIFEKK
ncbi:MAG: outer membrane lipid asymmetry maintenance protein MlaD [Dissulfuribacterales bacterium]